MAGVVAGRALDLDDVGPEVAEHHGGVRAGEIPGKVGDHDAGQRLPGSGWLLGSSGPGRWVVGHVLSPPASCRCAATAPGALAIRTLSANPPVLCVRCQLPGAGRPARAGTRVRRDLPERPVRRHLPAARISRGRCSLTSVATLVSAACTVTSIAAGTPPSPSRTGTATERIPGASSSSASAQRRAASCAARPRRLPGRGALRGQAGTAGLGQRRGEGCCVQCGQQHLALGRLQSRGIWCR